MFNMWGSHCEVSNIVPLTFHCHAVTHTPFHCLYPYSLYFIVTLTEEFTSLYFIVLKKDMHFTTHDHI